MPEHNPQDSILFMLGEMRADLKYLVNERHKQADRIDSLEATVGARLTKIENFKTRIGVVTTSLGVLVPTGITAAAHKFGLF